MDEENIVFRRELPISCGSHQQGQKEGSKHVSYQDPLQNLDKASTASVSVGDDRSGAQVTPSTAEIGPESDSLEKLGAITSKKCNMRTAIVNSQKLEDERIPKKTRIRRTGSKPVDDLFEEEEYYYHNRKLDFVQSEQKQEEKLLNMIKLAEDEHLDILLNMDANYSWSKLDPVEAERFSPCMAIL